MRLINETAMDSHSNVKHYLAKVMSVDKDYVVTFSIPGILENLSKYPTAYPKYTDHVREVKPNDSILVEQLDTAEQFFTYTVVNRNHWTGMYFGDVYIDITDGKTIHIDTPNVEIRLDSVKNTMWIGNQAYSINQWLEDIDAAFAGIFMNCHHEGAPNFGPTWYASLMMPPMKKIMKIFPTSEQWHANIDRYSIY